MSWNLSPYRIGLFVCLLGAYWLIGGFEMPVVDANSHYDSGRVAKAWWSCVLLALGGAGCISLVDHFTGNLTRSNIRILYILLGLMLMGCGYLWSRMLL
jgi:hypothetical protein